MTNKVFRLLIECFSIYRSWSTKWFLQFCDPGQEDVLFQRWVWGVWDRAEANLKVLVMSHIEVEATAVCLDKAGKMALYF